MVRFLVLRLVGAVWALFAALTLVFVLSLFLPDPPAHSAGGALSTYLSFLSAPTRPYTRELLAATRVTFVLVCETALVTAVLAVPFGFLLAARSRWVPTRLLSLVAVIAASYPWTVLSIMLVQLFVFVLHLFPPIGPGGTSIAHLFADVPAMVLPVFTLAIPIIGRFGLIVRGSVRDQQLADYVRTARAKGVGTPRILLRHQLPNVAGSILNYAAATVPITLSGLIIIEGNYNLTGLGFVLQGAAGVTTNGTGVSYPDPSLELSTMVMIAIFTVAVTFVLDVLAAALDPRV